MPSTTEPRLPLSARERDVVTLVARGLSMKHIAAELYLAEETAKQYLKRARAKYENAGRPAHNTVLVAHRAIEDGLLDISGPSTDESSSKGQPHGEAQ